MPVLACTEVNRTARVVPTNQAAAAVVMNSAIVVRGPGRRRCGRPRSSPPVAKIQLPNRVRSSTQVASAVTSTHHRMATRNSVPPMLTVSAKTASAPS